MATLPETSMLLLERDGSRLTVLFNRPSVRNAISAAMWQELDDVFAAIRGDRTIRTVVLRGAGGNFSAGGDLKERDTASGIEAVVERNMIGGTILDRIDRAPQAIVAVVQGNTLGGGFGLTCVADVVIADATVKFRLPEVGIGIPPAQIAPYVIRRVGISQARRLALTAATVGGDEALNLGLAHFLCADENELEACLAKVLADIDRCGPSAIGSAKELLRVASGGGGAEYVEYAARAFAEAYLSEEGQEGALAIREKRAPRWRTGKS